MRRVLLLVVAASLLVWATSSTASWRDTRQRSYGDPDEFQSTRVLDQDPVRRIVPYSVRDGAPLIRARTEPRPIYHVLKERQISIDFSGRRFFLEK